MIVIAALYKFTSLPDYRELISPLFSFCQDLEIKGTLLLAGEGINGTVAGKRQSIDVLYQYLLSDPRFKGLEYKESLSPTMPFYRLKVRPKKEIVTLGVPTVDPTQQVGQYVDPQAWNELIADPEVIIIDTRNDYEVSIGTFKNASNPCTKSFREFPQYVQKNLDPKKHKKVAMFCTGGIRCEKASSYMLSQGFENVYHLKGGILKYLETTPPENSLWEGECFVFDQRVAVQHGVTPGEHKLCYSCRAPLSPEDCSSTSYEEGISCPHCIDDLTVQRRERLQQRQQQVTLAKSRGTAHIGV